MGNMILGDAASSIGFQMVWPKASKELEHLLDELVSEIDCEKKRMFGAPVYFANHSMFAGVFADDIFLRLSEVDRQRFAKENHGAKPFVPVEGRQMREYVIAPRTLLKNQPSMRNWLFLSSEYAKNIRK